MELDGEKVLEVVVKGKINGARQVTERLGDNNHHNVKATLQLLIDELEDALRVSTSIKLSRRN